MVQRAEPPRDELPFRVTPLLLTTLIAAIVSTVGLALLWYVDANAHGGPAPPGGGPPAPPPPSHAALTIAVGIFGIAWAAVIMAAIRDQILRRIDQIATRVAAATIEFAEQREEEGVFRGMNMASGRVTDPDSDPDPGSGGHVLPFPR